MPISHRTPFPYSDEEFRAASRSNIANEFTIKKNLAIHEAAVTRGNPHSPKESQLSAITRSAPLGVVSPKPRCGWSEQIPVQSPSASGGDR